MYLVDNEVNVESLDHVVCATISFVKKKGLYYEFELNICHLGLTFYLEVT